MCRPANEFLFKSPISQQLSVLTIHFLSLLLERDRLKHLPGIASCYRRLLNEAKGQVEAKVVSASALAPALVDRVREQLRGLSGKEVVLQQEVDPSSARRHDRRTGRKSLRR